MNNMDGLRAERYIEESVEPRSVRESRGRVTARAEAALRAGCFDSAILHANRVLQEDEEHIGALEVLAKALWAAGHFEAVLEAVRRLLSLNAYEPGYHALMGAAFQALGRYGDSLRAYERSGDTPGAREAARELQNLQAALVADLLRSDPVFRAHYAQDPDAACSARGFAFQRVQTLREPWVATPIHRAALFVRPS